MVSTNIKNLNFIDKYQIAPKIEEQLNVICVISNPCNYKRRIELAKIFIKYMLNTKNVRLFLVECIYPKLGQTTYQLTLADNSNHLQLVADTVLWTKENMINLAVQKLLPADYKAFAFLDADLYFNNKNWVDDTLKALSCCDVLQPFEIGYNLNKFNKIENICAHYYSYCYFENNKNILNKSEFKHTGWGWAMTRNAYEKMGGLYDFCIIGGGDSILAKSLTIPNYMLTDAIYSKCSEPFIQSLINYQKKCCGLTIGYSPGIIYHLYHGMMKNRFYVDRWSIIINYKYDPNTFLIKNECGMYQASELFPSNMINDIVKYFHSRNEDQ